MKKIKRLAALLVAFMMLCSQAIGFAAAEEPETDIWSMTSVERGLWALENMDPTYVGTLEPGMARDTWLYTNTHTTYFRPDSNSGRMVTRLKFLPNASYTKLLDWGIDRYSVTDSLGGIITTDDVIVYKVSDEIWQITFDATITTGVGVCYVSHIYHVYASGTYAFRDPHTVV